MLRLVDGHIRTNENIPTETMHGIIGAMTGGKADSLQSLAVHGLASMQTDLGQREAVSALRHEAMDLLPTHEGVLRPGS